MECIIGFVGILAAIWCALWLRYRRKIRSLRDAAPFSKEATKRCAPRVTIHAWASGTHAVLGLRPKRRVRFVGRMDLSEDRFVLTTDRCVFLDLTQGGSMRLASVRCTAPSRLVIEGKIPQASGEPGNYRLELTFADAEQWAHELQPFVAAEGPNYAVVSPLHRPS